MVAQQRVVRVRREYNQWVADETLEDYALRFTAKGARKWSAARVANTAIGSVSFLALEAIGATLMLSVGFTNTAAAIAVVGLLIFAMAMPVCYYAAKYGVDIDLLTRGAGFGYIGSTITSLIYASFTFIFFAIEAVIMAYALEMLFGLPLSAGYVVSALVVIPLVTHGFTFISRFQAATQPLWIGLHLLPFIFIGIHGLDDIAGWTSYAGRAGAPDGSFNLLLFGAASSVLFALVAQIGEQVDILRFLPRNGAKSSVAWWAALIAAGPGWIVIGAIKLFAGALLAYLALSAGKGAEQAADPNQMYLVAFGYVTANPGIALGLTGVFVILSQLKINVTNSYAGSIAWSNFFSRLTHRHPGRVVWLVFNVAIALMLMELGIYRALEHILGLYAHIAVAWVGALVADLVICKPLGLSPRRIEFKRAHLYDINPVGLGSMLLASAASILAYSGMLGDGARALSSYIALVIAFTAVPLIALATRSRFYIAREPRADWGGRTRVNCCICEHEFETEDMAGCPAYNGPICSLCCSLDARCHDLCKRQSRMKDQLLGGLRAILPAPLVERLNSSLGHYLALILIVAAMLGGVLSLIYLQTVIETGLPEAALRGMLFKTFIVFMLITGVVAWLFVLTHESRRAAQEEVIRQTDLLLAEIEAHKRTDQLLQQAKDLAEAANQAKSRYVTGISHELRTPLNSIFGYAQLLERDNSIPPHRRNAILIMRRSAQHLAGLIEGLLDISKIEAGRLQLNREEVRTKEFLAQLLDMFRMQADARGIEFRYDVSPTLPDVVNTDEKRLRQICINLLSNAIKFTERGYVSLRVTYRNQIAEFEIEDTGVGIPSEDIKRVFEPFARGHAPVVAATPGTGLGLTITSLLTDIMGGELTLTSTPGVGTRVRVRLMLASVHRPRAVPAKLERIVGYTGPRRTVLVADDDPTHLALIEDILRPLDFILFTAPDGHACLAMAAEVSPDLALLDITMPGMTGWEIAHRLRESERSPRIIMITADAADIRRPSTTSDQHDSMLAKPVDIAVLLDRIQSLLEIEWKYASPDPEVAPPETDIRSPSANAVEQLRRLGRIGHTRGIEAKLDELATTEPHTGATLSRLRNMVREFDLKRYMATLETLDRRDV